MRQQLGNGLEIAFYPQGSDRTYSFARDNARRTALFLFSKSWDQRLRMNIAKNRNPHKVQKREPVYAG